jgi:Flp pilus assembly protein TadG
MPRPHRHPLDLLYRRFWRGTNGAATMEFALVSLLFFTLLFGVIQVGLLFWTQTGLNYATEQAARYYSVQSAAAGADISASTVTTYAATQAPGLNFPTSAFTAGKAACGQASASNYQVTATYQFNFIPSGLMPASPTLSASACFP